VQDFRPQSYKDLADDRFSDSPTSGYDVSLNPDNVVSGAGQSAIQDGDRAVVFTPNSTESGASPGGSGGPSSSTTPSNPFTPAQGVEVSPGVASKLSQQSLRDDARYYATPSAQRNKQSIDNTPPTPPSKSRFQRVKEGLAQPTNILGYTYQGAKYLFTGKTSGETTNVIYGVKVPFSVPVEQVYASDLLVGAGTMAIAKPVTIGRTDVKMGLRATTETATTESGAATMTSRVRGAGVVETRVAGVKIRSEPFRVVGVVKENAKPIDTDVFGLSSQEEVYGLSGRGRIKIVPSKSGSVLVESDTSGFSVAGAGKRQVSQVVTGTKGIKQGVGEVYSETFISEQAGDVTRTGVVSRKGSSVSVGVKQAELDITRPGGNVYFNPETGLESATPTLSFKPSEPVNVKYTKVSGAASSDLPFSGEYVYESAGARIRDNISPVLDLTKRDVVVGEVGGAARTQATSSGSNVVLMDVKSQVGSVARSELGGVRVPTVSTPGVLSVETVKQSAPVSVGVVKQVSITRSELGSVGLVQSKQVTSVGSVQSSSSVQELGMSSFQDVRRLSSSKSSLGVESLSKSDVGVVSVSALGSATRQVQRQEVVPDTIFSPARGLVPGVGTRFDTAFSPKFGLGGVRFSGGEKGVFGVSVRRGGVFRQVGGGLSLKDAVSLGSGRVRGTAAASFQVTRGNAPVQISAPRGFYKKGNVLIEQNEFRINQSGELREITYKGIGMNRRGGF
jgi:hypothetical protein